MSFLSNISWSQFLSVVIPLYAVAMAAIWIYYEKIFTGGDSSQESEASRFAAKPLADEDVPDEDEGFIIAESEPSEGNELLDDIYEEREQEIEKVRSEEIEQAKAEVDDRKREEEGMSSEFDESRGFDSDADIEEFTEDQTQFLYMQQSEMFYTEQEYVESDGRQPDEDAYVPVEQTFGSDNDYLIATSQLSFETMSDEQMERLKIADSVNDIAINTIKNMQRGSLPEETNSLLNNIYKSSQQDGEEVSVPDGDDDFSQGFSAQEVSEDMFGQKPMDEL